MTLTKRLSIKPDYAEAHNSLGNVLNILGQIKAGAKCFEKAIAINPNFADVFFNLGILYYDLGQPEEALNYYRACMNKTRYGFCFR